MLSRPAGPSIPERSSARTSAFGAKELKRRSVTASSRKGDRRHSSNRVIVKPASTEVISSLIDTLSAISIPVEEHFDPLPDIHESQISQPSRSASGGPDCSRQESKVDGASRHLECDEDGKKSAPSPIASTRKASRRQSARESSRNPKDVYSIGKVSVERQPQQSSTSLASLGGSDTGRGLEGVWTLKSSRESFEVPSISVGEKQKRRSRKADTQMTRSQSPSPEPPNLEISKRMSRPEVTSCLSTYREAFHRADSISYGPNESADNADKTRSSSVNGQDVMPRRESSILHNTRARELRRLSDPNWPADPAVSLSEAIRFPDRPQSKVLLDAVLDHTVVDGSAEEGVTRRIQELKEQKRERLRVSMIDSPGDDLLLTTPPRNPPSAKTLEIHTSSDHDVCSQLQCPTDSETMVDGLTLEDSSAPPPTIRTSPIRIVENQVASCPTDLNRLAIPRHRPSQSRNEIRSTSLTPQRHPSRLQKRLSVNGNFAVSEKQRRRISTPLPQSLRQSSYQRDELDSINDAVAEYLTASRLSQTVKCAHSGRVISFSEVGDPDGAVVFCCVGMGLTRYVMSFYDELAATLKLRLITPDRPGVGGSASYTDGNDTPLGWPDDIRTICENLRITKFSLLAHSAGAIYALATALRMPQHIRCRVHLLAPWIPPSQMSATGTHQEPLPSTSLPYSQRFLRSLPTTFLRVANSKFLSITSNRITTSLPGSPKRSKRALPFKDDHIVATADAPTTADAENSDSINGKGSKPPLNRRGASAFDNITTDSRPDLKKTFVPSDTIASIRENNDGRQTEYLTRLTEAIWEAATTNANAAVDLIVCLERRQPIGFRYVDITRAVVIHHGSKDSRVPPENVKWLGNMMRRCEVRMLEGEGHGLMASAAVMGNVLMELSKEWEDWMSIVKGRRR